MSNQVNRNFLTDRMRLRPTWTTWVMLGFAGATLVATVIGFWLAGKPFWP